MACTDPQCDNGIIPDPYSDDPEGLTLCPPATRTTRADLAPPAPARVGARRVGAGSDVAPMLLGQQYDSGGRWDAATVTWHAWPGALPPAAGTECQKTAGGEGGGLLRKAGRLPGLSRVGRRTPAVTDDGCVRRTHQRESAGGEQLLPRCGAGRCGRSASAGFVLADGRVVHPSPVRREDTGQGPSSNHGRKPWGSGSQSRRMPTTAWEGMG